MNFKCTGASR